MASARLPLTMARPGRLLQPFQPAFGGLMLQALALWPHGRWMLERVQDGSDDPLGLAALAALGILLWLQRETLLPAPKAGWLLASLTLSAVATAALWWWPPLPAALLAALALAAGLWAWLPATAPRLPLAGLLVLSLPLLASLQFYGGYPLRVITAQFSAWLLLATGVDAHAAGASLLVRGQLVLVDAPCSGVQMVWMAYFCACTVAALSHLDSRRFLNRLPGVGLLVLVGNVARNTVLVSLESRPEGLSAAAHQAIGVAALALVCMAVVALFSPRGAGDKALAAPTPAPLAATRTWPALLACCALWPVLALLPVFLPAAASAVPVAAAAAEWPREWEGRQLRPLAMSAVEQRFAARFPGAIGRFTDGQRTLVLRRVTQPTRMLHPAADCFRAIGHQIDTPRLERDAAGRLQRCFVARPADSKGLPLRVCERIEGSDGSAFTDTSAWYWAATLQRSQGPWLAVTTVELQP